MPGSALQPGSRGPGAVLVEDRRTKSGCWGGLGEETGQDLPLGGRGREVGWCWWPGRVKKRHHGSKEQIRRKERPGR